MLRQLLSALLRLRTWLLVRLGLWRGRWRRGLVTVPAARAYPGLLANDTWSYGLYVPAGLPDAQAAPLIVVLHGCRQRALAFAYASGWTRWADRARVRLLCPDQRRRANLWRCWNWFLPPAQRGRGEALMVLAAIDAVADRVRVDPPRIAVVGLSAGAGLAALLAFHHADRIRAAAVVAAPPLLGAMPVQDPRDVMAHGLRADPTLAVPAARQSCAPLAIIHGLADTVVHPRCAQQLMEQALASLRRAGRAPDLTEVHAADDRGAGRDVTTIDHRSSAGLHVRRIEVAGLAHQWAGGPGGHPYCEREGPDLTGLCARFFTDAGVLGSASRG
jgi:poly(hydroxyalkanoate) depolymerase family esterase